MKYARIRQRNKQFESVTGLKVEEFDFLLPFFGDRWKKFYRFHTIEGKKRKAPIFKPAKNTKSLPSVEEKLFFILVYLRNYSLQEMLAASFDFSQSQASKWQKVLLPVLTKALNDLNMLPEQDGSKVAQKLIFLGEDKVFQDASERTVQRPGDQDTQGEFYSGKKKPIP